MDKNRYEILAEIQDDISVPKSRYNDFGKYNYRSYEDIVEAAKPVCRKHRATLECTDEAVSVDGWHYVKATATLHFWDSENDEIEVVAYAREAHDKKGSDVSQITGMASTYARKYALCGLFSIDGQDDADAIDNSRQGNVPSYKSLLWDEMKDVCAGLGLDPNEGAKTMKKLPEYEDTDDFYESLYMELKVNPGNALGMLFPDKEI